MTIYVITLCYNRPDIIRRSLEAYKEKCSAFFYAHILVDNKFPLPNRDMVSAELVELARDMGCLLLDPGANLGLSGGFNFALKHIKPEPNDIIIGYDGDSNPLTSGFDTALVQTLQADPTIAWASCVLPAAIEQLQERGYVERTVAGRTVWETRQAVVNSICAWPYWFLGDRGLEEPNHFYGGLEGRMFGRLLDRKKKWAFLPDYREDNAIKLDTDKEYVLYKYSYAHEHSWTGDFDSYLAAGCPHRDANGMTVKLFDEFKRGNKF